MGHLRRDVVVQCHACGDYPPTAASMLSCVCAIEGELACGDSAALLLPMAGLSMISACWGVADESPATHSLADHARALLRVCTGGRREYLSTAAPLCGRFICPIEQEFVRTKRCTLVCRCGAASVTIAGVSRISVYERTRVDESTGRGDS